MGTLLCKRTLFSKGNGIFYAEGSPYTLLERTIIIRYLSRKFSGHKSICGGKYKNSQILFIIDAAVINAAYILTSGVFLSGFVISLKASDFIVAFLNNAGIWASILSIFSFLILERIKRRKKLLIITNIISRIFVSGIVFVPLFFTNQKLIIAIVAIMVIIADILWGIYQLGWMIWYMEIAPEGKKNDYVYLRMFLVRIAFTITTLVMGYVLDYYNKSYTGFLVVFISSLILSIVDIIILIFVEEPEYKVPERSRSKKDMFLEPFKSIEFRKFLVFIFAFYLFLTISTSFTSIYLIRYLNFDYGFISTINVISYIVMILGTKFWGKLQNKYGNIFVLKYSAIFVIADFLIYFLLTEKTYFLLFLSCLVGGIGNGGFNIAIMAYRFEIMPESAKSIYEGWFKAIYGASVLIAPVIGELLIKIMPDLSKMVFPISKFQFLYIISFVTGGLVVLFTFIKPGFIKNKFINQNSIINH